MFAEFGRRTPAELRAHDRVYARWARREMRTGTFFAIIAETADGRPMASGAVWLMPQQPRPGRLARPVLPYVLSMYTERRFRGQGAASRIVGEMVDWAREHRYPRIFLHASKMGRPVYERLGFRAANEMRRDLPVRRR